MSRDLHSLSPARSAGERARVRGLVAALTLLTLMFLANMVGAMMLLPAFAAFLVKPRPTTQPG